jgi:predicted phage-related endonuclease
MTNIEIKEMLKNAKELKRMAEEIAAELASIEDGVKAELTARAVDTLIVDEYKVTWKEVTSTRIDTTAIKKALPEIAERFSKTTTAKRFCIA